MLRRVSEVSREAWDALVPAGAEPLLSWDFLDVLERTGCASPDRGWTPCHPTLWRGSELVAAAPGWVKTHSMGEFFYNDFRWPAVTPRFGVSYFPKLVLGVPFSPITGPRLLVAPGEGDGVRARLIALARRHARETGLSSVNVLFVPGDELDLLREDGLSGGAGVQFHWENSGYESFDAFLARFNAKRRRMVRDERARLEVDGTGVRTLRGSELTPELMRFVARCYESTVDRHAWNAPHLNEAFFVEVAAALPERVEVVLAEEDGRPLGAAFNLRGDRRLYGRTWGALENRRYLHFNVCYYHSIQRCIDERLEAFEPGAGGEHKLARGFEPTVVRSAHWFVEPRLNAAMGAHLERESSLFAARVAEAREAGLAFKSGSSRLDRGS